MRFQINQAITGSSMGRSNPGPVRDSGSRAAPLPASAMAYKALPRHEEIRKAVNGMRAAPAVNVTASANTGTGRLMNRTNSVGVCGNSSVNLSGSSRPIP